MAEACGRDKGWNWARVGSRVGLHLCKTGGDGMGVRAGIRSQVGEDGGDANAVAVGAEG